VLACLCPACLTGIASGDNKQLSQTAWAFAFLMHRGFAPREANTTAALDEPSEFASQQLANLAQLSANIEYNDVPSMQLTLLSSLNVLDSFRVPEWSGLAWAMAVRYCQVNSVMETVVECAIRRSHALEEQFIINTAWMCAGMGFMHEPFREIAVVACRAKLSEHQPHTLGNLGRYLWVMRFSDRNEFTKDMTELCCLVELVKIAQLQCEPCPRLFLQYLE